MTEDQLGIYGHGDMPGFSEEHSLAQGRYDSSKHKTSLTFDFSNAFPHLSLHTKEKLKERVEKIIDKKLNNPEIIETTPGYMWR